MNIKPSAATEHAVSERTPLLPSLEDAPALGTSVPKQHPEDRPLPTGQLLLLCFARLTEPVAFFSIFVYVNEFVYETGIPREQCGWYTGLIESLFSLVQFAVMPFWGRFSDTRGRKPILILSLFGLSITSVLFGLSNSVYQMMAYRCLSGAFGASIVTTRTMLAEISTSKTQARAFSLFGFAGNAAICLAPLLGGALSKPAEHFGVFKHFQLFIKFPYLLPCLVTGGLAFVSAIISMLFLQETLNVDRGKTGAVTKSAPTTRDILASPGVKPVLSIYLYTAFLVFAYSSLSTVASFSDVSLGGYGLTPAEISYLLACGGAGQAFFTLIVFPPLHSRSGSRGILRFSATLWCVCIFVYSGLNLALRAGLPKAAFWTVALLVSLLSSAVSMSFASTQLCINDISPSPASLGSLNGIAMSGISAVRSFAPVSINGIFALGVQHHVLYGQLGWLVMFIAALGYVVVVRYLPKKAYGLPVALGSRGPATDEEQGS